MEMGKLPVGSLVYSTWSCLAQTFPIPPELKGSLSPELISMETKETADQPCTYSARLLSLIILLIKFDFICH